MRSHYSVTGNSSIPLKYHPFSTQSPTTLINLSHLSISSIILSQQTSGSSICNCSGPLLLPHYVITQVWFWWPQHMTPVVWRCMVKLQNGWSTSSQWHNYNNLCLMCAVWSCNVTMKDHISWQMSKSLPANSLIKWSHQVLYGIHIDCCAPRHDIRCGWFLCIQENRCHNFSSTLTDFKLFASQRIWVLPLHFSLYCLSEMMHPYLTACHCGFQELMSFFKPLKM